MTAADTALPPPVAADPPQPAPLLAIPGERARTAIAAALDERPPAALARTTLTLMAETTLLARALREDVADADLTSAARAAIAELAERHPRLFVADGERDGPGTIVTPPATPATKAGRRWFAKTPRQEPARVSARAMRPAPRMKPPRKPITIGGWLLRDVALALGAVVALLAIGFVLLGPAPATTGAGRTATSSVTGQSVAVGGQSPDVSSTGSVADTSPVVGSAEVIDAVTLRIAGRILPLFGLEPAAGRPGTDLVRYLAGRPVACRPAGAASYECGVDGRDLSEVVLFNGGSRAASDATPALVAAEDHARAQRLGVWRR